MPGLDETIFQVSAIDDFSETLTELKEELLQVDAIEEEVDPIDIDARVAEALADLAAVKSAQETIDEEMTIDVDADREALAAMGRMFGDEGGAGGGFVPTPSGAAGGGGVGRAPEPEGVPDRHRRGGGLLGGLADLLSGDRGFSLMTASSREAMEAVTGGGDDDSDIADMSMGDIWRQFRDIQLRMGTIMSIIASLVPLLVVVVGALPALIGGLAALTAAALAAAGALGVVGALVLGGLITEGGEFDMTEARQEFKELIDSLLESFAPLMDALEGQAARGLDVLASLGQQLAMDLRMVLGATDELGAAFRGLGEAFHGFIVGMVAFGTAAMPLMNFLGQQLANMDLFQVFAGLLVKSLPLLAAFARAVFNILPGLFELSLGFFAVLTVITEVFSWLWQIIDLIPLAGETLGVLVGVLLAAVTASSLYSLAQASLQEGVLASVKALLLKIKAMWADAAATYGAAAATLAFAAAAAVAIAVVTLGLSVAVGALASKFDPLTQNINESTAALKQFNHAAKRTQSTSPFATGAGGGIGSGGPYSYGNAEQIVVNAPDVESGNRAANSVAFQTDNTDSSDSDNRKHAGK